MCFEGWRQFVVSGPCTNCRRRQFVHGATICGIRVLHKLSPATICAGATICGATTYLESKVVIRDRRGQYNRRKEALVRAPCPLSLPSPSPPGNSLIIFIWLPGEGGGLGISKEFIWSASLRFAIYFLRFAIYVLRDPCSFTKCVFTKCVFFREIFTICDLRFARPLFYEMRLFS